LRTKDICAHCGETGPDDFLLRLPQLQARNLTDGWSMLPTCIHCIAAGKKRARKSGGKQNKVQALREKRTRVAASTAARAAEN